MKIAKVETHVSAAPDYDSAGKPHSYDSSWPRSWLLWVESAADIRLAYEINLGFVYTFGSRRMSPVAARSGCIKWLGLPASRLTASAAR